MNRLLLALCNLMMIVCFTTNLGAQDRPYLTLLPGMELTRDLRFAPYEYNFYETDFQPIIIQGDNFTLDFSGAKLYGTEPSASPNQYGDVAIIIRNARNVKIENLNIHRFQVAIYMENSENIYFRNCDFSYNQRPKLYSDRDHIIFNDSIQTVQLGQGELAAFSAFNSHHCTLESVKISHGQHGIIFKNCEQMDVFNSIITFNSGIGISLINSHQNQIRHCRLDYHNRGFSYGGFYQEFGAAGIFLNGGSTNNQIGYNSITHCDKGIRQMPFDPKNPRDSRINTFYKNDFSFCPMVGLELNGDAAIIQENIFKENRQGIYASGLQHIDIIDNTFSIHDVAIQLENCLRGESAYNEIKDSRTGIFLQESTTIKENELQNKYAFNIFENRLYKVGNPFVILDTSGSNIQSNEIYRASYIPDARRSKNITLKKNIFNQYEGKMPSIFFRWKNRFTSNIQDTVKIIRPIEESPIIASVDLPMNTEVWPYLERGIESIMMTEYGPYNFKFPFLYMIGGYPLRLKVMGPVDGAWSLVDEHGIKMMSDSPGIFPDTIEIKINEQVHFPNLQFKYTGRSFIDRQGRSISPDEVFYFHYPENKNKHFISFRDVDSTHSFSNCESSTIRYIQTKMNRDSVGSSSFGWARISLPEGSYKLTCFDISEPYVCLNNEMIRLTNLPSTGQSELPIEIKSGTTSITIFNNKQAIANTSSCLIEKVDME